MMQSPNLPKARTRRARCKRVLVIVTNQLETLDLVREVIPPPLSDFGQGPLDLAVVRFEGLEVYVPCSCVVFLRNETPKRKPKLPTAVKGDLRFISENMRLSGFSGKITPELVKHALKLHRRVPALACGKAHTARVLGNVLRIN